MAATASHTLRAPSYDDICDAASRIREYATRTPLVRLNVDAPGGRNIYLKLENLQAIGSFKIRPAANAVEKILTSRKCTGGFCTASAGNFGQGLAYFCRKQGISCTIVVPDHTPKIKLKGMKKLGARIVKVSFEEWWRIIVSHQCPQAPMDSVFIHPGAESSVLAGNATIALEIYQDLPEVDLIVVPYGSGALATGIACGMREIASRHNAEKCRVVAVEPETAAPFRESIRAGCPVDFSERYSPSFVDGCGGKSVLLEIWDIAKNVIDDGVAVSLRNVRRSIRLMLESNRIVSEGAGACPVAAALYDERCSKKSKNIVCVVSGGGLDTEKLINILQEKEADCYEDPTFAANRCGRTHTRRRRTRALCVSTALCVAVLSAFKSRA